MTPRLGQTGTAPEPSVELLAHYELVSDSELDTRRGFAILLELDERRLLLETDTAFEAGDELLLNFFLADSGTERAKISLTCVVSHCRDENMLRYSARVSRIEDGSKEAVQRFAARIAGRGAA